MKTKKT